MNDFANQVRPFRRTDGMKPTHNMGRENTGLEAELSEAQEQLALY